MSNAELVLQARSLVVASAARMNGHAASVFRWSIVVPVLVAILFFGAFTTVYILMRRPSFGERGVVDALVVTPDAEPVATRP